MKSLSGALLGLLTHGLALLTLTAAGMASDWPQFRGVNGSGISPDTTPLPDQWSETKNLQWKVDLPGPGHSCPIVVGDKVFVTCWSGYGTSRTDAGSQEKLERHLVCVDRKSGKILWSKSVKASLPEDRYGGMFAENGYASHTPVSDGKRMSATAWAIGVGVRRRARFFTTTSSSCRPRRRATR